MVGPPVWRRALADTGYGEIEFLGSAAATAGRMGGSAGEAEHTAPSTAEDRTPGSSAEGVNATDSSAVGVGAAVILARGPAEVRAEPGLWVLCGGRAREGVGAELVRTLEAQGQTVVLTDGADGRSRPVDASRRESWRALFEGLPAWPPLWGVVHLDALIGHGPAATAPELAEDVERAGRSALALSQGLQDAGVRPASGLWFVTTGGQPVREGEEASGQLCGSLLWGFGRTAARELEDLRVGLVDLDPEDAAAAAGRLAGELLFPDGETEVAWRSDRRLVPRLVRLAPGAGLPPASNPVRADRSYLVTGGFGGIGLRLAGWLADRGSGAVVLSGSRPPDGAEEEAIGALRNRGRGVEVRVVVADVSDGTGVERMLSELSDSGLPPLGGVIHGEEALSDGLLSNQDWESFERVLWPQVLGAWRLHRATEELELELFVLSSRLAGVLGTAGQANRAAASAFLDRLAAHRRARGLAGQSIQWGAWSVAGEAGRRPGVAARPAAAGVGRMTPEQGLQALARLVGSDIGTAVAALVDWPAAGAAAGRRRALLGELASDAGEEAVPHAADDLPSRLRSTRAADREGLLVEFVRGQVRAVLRLPSVPSPEVGFFDLGMDSLMAVELRNRLNRTLAGECTVPNTVVFDHPTIARLARHLAAQLGYGPGSESVATERESGEGARQEYERVRQMQLGDFLAEAEALLGDESKSAENGDD